jgi:GxxExxY protein
MEEINKLTEKIIGCAIEVHRVLGPGLLESVYEEALCVELSDTGMKFQRQVNIPAVYKGRLVNIESI